MTILINVYRESVRPCEEPIVYAMPITETIKTKKDNSDYIVTAHDMIETDGWENKIKDIPDDVDIAFLSDSPITLSAPRVIGNQLYSADVAGCMYALYISGTYHNKIKRYNNIESKIKNDIYLGTCVAAKFYPQILFCNPNMLHYGSEDQMKELRGLSSIDARKVYTGYAVLIIALVLVIALCYCLYYISTMKADNSNLSIIGY